MILEVSKTEVSLYASLLVHNLILTEIIYSRTLEIINNVLFRKRQEEMEKKLDLILEKMEKLTSPRQIPIQRI